VSGGLASASARSRSACVHRPTCDEGHVGFCIPSVSSHPVVKQERDAMSDPRHEPSNFARSRRSIAKAAAMLVGALPGLALTSRKASAQPVPSTARRCFLRGTRIRTLTGYPACREPVRRRRPSYTFLGTCSDSGNHALSLRKAKSQRAMAVKRHAYSYPGFRHRGQRSSRGLARFRSAFVVHRRCSGAGLESGQWNFCHARRCAASRCDRVLPCHPRPA
jgi:hypothetical protein